MDEGSYIGAMDIYYINNEDMFKQNKIIIKDGIILTYAYDDVCNIQPTKQPFWVQNKCNEPSTCKYGYDCSKKHCIMCVVLLTSIIAATALSLHHYMYNTSDVGITKSKYSTLNPDLCDPVNPYYVKDWFLPSPFNKFYCDIPIAISEIYFEDVTFFSGLKPNNCMNKLTRIAEIGVYLAEHNYNAKYNFFIDYNSNVYAARDWLCLYESGQLWVTVISDTYSTNGESEVMKVTLKHFNNELVRYALKCGFFNSSSLANIYLNNTFLISKRG